jgi:hypothetical protein
MVGRIAAVAAIAVLAGLALSLRDLVIPPPRQVPLPVGDLVLMGWLLALVVIGWATAQLIDPPVRFLAAPVAGLIAFGVALAAKQVRYPGASLVGDGFEVLILIYAAFGLLGAGLGSLSALQTRPPERAAGVTAGLIVVTGVLGAVPYILAR